MWSRWNKGNKIGDVFLLMQISHDKSIVGYIRSVNVPERACSLRCFGLEALYLQPRIRLIP